jgi:ribosomal protein S18 acetylase RimI-like enzyme
MDVRSLGYRTDLALLRLGGSTIEDGGDHLIVRSPHNAAHWWGNFMLLAEVPDPKAASAWVERFAATFPRAGHIAIGFDAARGTKAELAWFSANGFDVEASTVMTATEVRPPRSVNTDAVCRVLDSDDDWDQSVDLRIRCFPDKADSQNHEKYVRTKTNVDRDLVSGGHGAWFGAFLDGRLVGELGLVRAAGIAGDDRVSPGLARFQSVETDPKFRRQGLAGTLAYRASRFGFDELGARTLVMVADPDYFAIDLYRSLGFQATESQLQVQRAPKTSS